MKYIAINILVLSILFSINASSQCKFKTDDSDPFTSEKHRISNNIRLNGDMKSANEAKFYAITNLEQTGDEFKWNFNFYELVLRDQNSLKSIKIKIKTNTGIIEINSDVIPDPKYTMEPNLKITELVFNFNLSREDLKKLAEGVEIVGIDIFGENKLFKLKSNEEIAVYAKCLLE